LAGVSGARVTLAVEVVTVSWLISPDRRRLAMWCVAPALPAVLGSLLLMLVLLGWAAAWEPVAMLAWLAIGLLLLTRPGERIALRMSGFRRPTLAQRSQLEPAMLAAVERCGADPGSMDWYVRRSRDLNAYACGRRGVAVTTGLLADLTAGRLTAQMVSGVLVHEFGHHASGTTRYTLAVRWWAALWRVASRFVFGLTFGLIGRRQPPRLLAGVVIVCAVVAIAQAAQQHSWGVVSVLTALPALGVSAPLLDAAISRHSERVADDYASASGAHHELANALSAMREQEVTSRIVARVLAHHPDTEGRIEVLRAAPGG
jgi:Zn-dependent protease with chaperone function